MQTIVWFLWHAALGNDGNNERDYLGKEGIRQSFARTEQETLQRLAYAQTQTGVTKWRPQQIKLERVP